MFQQLGIPTKSLRWRDEKECNSAIQIYSLVIFYRVPGTPAVLLMINEAKRLGIPVFWEADDLIFNKELYSQAAIMNSMPSSTRKLLLDGAELYEAALRACGAGIASTKRIADAMKNIVPGPVHIIENAAANNLWEIAKTTKRKHRVDSKIVIFYGSGTNTHDVDFALVSSAIATVMTEFPNVELKLVGELTVPDALRHFGKRIAHLDFMPLQDYADHLASADISLAPLVLEEFNEAKSNIKFLEASIFGVPSICSPRQPFREIIQHNVNGFLAETTTEWESALRCLILDASLRRQIGVAAKQSVWNRYRIETLSISQLAPWVSGYSKENGHDKIRVLVCNVFFSPDSFGGATVIAEQMARHLNEYDNITVLALATETRQELLPLEYRRSEHLGIPTIHVRLPNTSNTHLQYDHPEFVPYFSDIVIAFKPDVVHFHSIQGMGSAIVEYCNKQHIPTIVTVHDSWWLCARQFMVDNTGQFCSQFKIDTELCSMCTKTPELIHQRIDTLMSRLKEVTVVLAPSNYQESLYAINGIRKEKLRVNRNGVRKPVTLEVSKSTDGPIRFAVVSGDEPLKGARLIVKALALLPDYKDYELLVVDYTQNLGHTSVRKKNWVIPGQLRIVSAYNQHTIDQFFSQVDVLLFPTLMKESFGLTVREALIRDVWVIASDAGGVVEDIVPGENGQIFPLGSTNALSKAIRWVLDNPDRIKNHANKHKDKIRTFRQQADELYLIIKDTVRKDGSDPGS